MNFLQLINRARVECGVSGPALTTVDNLTGESARFANWINAAWIDLQTSKEDWLWMLRDFQFNLVGQKQIYTPADAGVGETFGNWKRDSFRCSSVGQDYKDEQLMNFMEYPTFRNLYQYGNMRYTYARPVVVSITPVKELAFGSIPDQPYVVTAQYYVKPTEMVAATDTPDIPERFHMLMVYRAMLYYAGFEAASEVYQRGELEYRRLIKRMEVDQLPTLVSGPPLA